MIVVSNTVPEVLSWSVQAVNLVEADHNLIKEAPGAQLSNSWDAMEIDDKAGVVSSLVTIEKMFQRSLSGGELLSASMTLTSMNADIK